MTRPIRRCTEDSPVPDNGTRSGVGPGDSGISSVADFTPSVTGMNATEITQVWPGPTLDAQKADRVNSDAFGPATVGAPISTAPVPLFVSCTVNTRALDTACVP